MNAKIYSSSCSHHSGGSFGIVFPFVGETGGSLEVTGQSVNSGLNQNQSVFGVFVLAALLQMSANVDCLLDQTVDILGNFGSTS